MQQDTKSIDFLQLKTVTLVHGDCVYPMRRHTSDGGPMRGEVVLEALLSTDAHRGKVIIGKNVGNRAEAAVYRVKSVGPEVEDLAPGDFCIPTSGAMEVLDHDSEDGGRFYVCARRFIRVMVDADKARALYIQEMEKERQTDEFSAPGLGRLNAFLPASP